ncbi:SMI1/KNR4 family protein [Thermoactinomyces sp. DSM 45892]|uniref:SMI1/KNR4 family protein n=1 Tax=Thermoactinomyces sp. DSM 45892 TaxID=1882753 RepID=UPI000896ADE3|nr:SMI1/KNR4 family protein [Thermoactinomyces sp. DSM 45892]SDX96800.1 SMI1-KNR4 cell-wall [Thermoactinomyces sp. DSM 45892]
MTKVFSTNDKLSIDEITQFEKKNDLQLPDQYKDFLLRWNGVAYTEPNLFFISKEQGPSVLNGLHGIGDMYDNLQDSLDIFDDDRLPSGFISIGFDPAGNQIVLGTKVPYYDHIYFWDHEEEAEDESDMSNMYFLANNIFDFLDSLYDDPSM